MKLQVISAHKYVQWIIEFEVIKLIWTNKAEYRIVPIVVTSKEYVIFVLIKIQNIKSAKDKIYIMS